MVSQEDLDRQFALKLHQEELRSIGKHYEPSDHDLEEDRLLAEKLHREQVAEYESCHDVATESTRSQTRNEVYETLLVKHKELSLVDPVWETIDPTPDIHTLFQVFDATYFDGCLKSCEVRWSPRMTMCAGLCVFQPRSRFCSIRLSKPLLSLRPRSDLVETLLHEMIHALLFLTQRNRDRDGHGPEFHKHMYRINKTAGTKISVYHSFHDEVRHFKVHHWRCSGPCKDRPPYFGWVKRSMNRAPSKNDFWWNEHQRNCGGIYVKVSGPEKQTSKPLKSKRSRDESPNVAQTSPLRKFFKSDAPSSTDLQPGPSGSGSFGGGGDSRGGGGGNSNNSSNQIGNLDRRSPAGSKRPGSKRPGSKRLTMHIPPTVAGNVTGRTSTGSQIVNVKSSVGSEVNSGKSPPIGQVRRKFVPFQGPGQVLGGSVLGKQNSVLTNRSLQPTIEQSLQGQSNSKTSKHKLKALALLDIFSSDEEEQKPQLNKAPPGQNEASRRPPQQEHHRPRTPSQQPIIVEDYAMTEVVCPICSLKVPNSTINEHIDSCLCR